MTGFVAIVVHLMELMLAFTTEEGSRQLVYGALAEDKDINGGFVLGAKVVESSDFVISKEGKKVQDKVWVSNVFYSSGYVLVDCLDRMSLLKF